MASAMILAAGAGTRLGPLTADLPKVMVPVTGRPVLLYILAWLRYHGVSEVAINLHHHSEVVVRYCQGGGSLGVRVTYSIEERLLGTAGGVKRVVQQLGDPFVVVYGDVLTDLDLTQLLADHVRRGSESHITVAVCHVEDPRACGIVELNSEARIVRFVEKPGDADLFSGLVHAGIMVVDSAVMNWVPQGRPSDFGTDLFPKLLEVGVPLYAWPVPETAYSIDIGTPPQYERAQREWPTSRARRFVEAWRLRSLSLRSASKRAEACPEVP